MMYGLGSMHMQVQMHLNHNQGSNLDNVVSTEE